MDLKNKTIIITGGTSGIGLQLVSQLYNQNKVIVIARPSIRLNDLSQQFAGVEVYPADLSKTHSYEMVSDQIIRKYNQIDLLINNAALQNTPTYLSDNFDYNKIVLEINVNFTAVCCLSYLLLSAMLNNEQKATILNINSGLALAPKTDSAIYAATKAAMNVFSQALSYQLENTDIRIFQAFLPLVETPMTRGRGKAKIDSKTAATAILNGLRKDLKVNDIGKVKVLRLLLSIFPWFARKIMKRA